MAATRFNRPIRIRHCQGDDDDDDDDDNSEDDGDGGGVDLALHNCCSSAQTPSRVLLLSVRFAVRRYSYQSTVQGPGGEPCTPSATLWLLHTQPLALQRCIPFRQPGQTLRKQPPAHLRLSELLIGSATHHSWPRQRCQQSQHPAHILPFFLLFPFFIPSFLLDARTCRGKARAAGGSKPRTHTEQAFSTITETPQSKLRLLSRNVHLCKHIS